MVAADPGVIDVGRRLVVPVDSGESRAKTERAAAALIRIRGQADVGKVIPIEVTFPTQRTLIKRLRWNCRRLIRIEIAYADVQELCRREGSVVAEADGGVVI